MSYIHYQNLHFTHVRLPGEMKRYSTSTIKYYFSAEHRLHDLQKLINRVTGGYQTVKKLARLSSLGQQALLHREEVATCLTSSVARLNVLYPLHI